MKRERLTLLLLGLGATLSVAAKTEIHVSPSTTKSGKGTLEAPFATIEEAKQYVSKRNQKMEEDITIYLHGGTYSISSPITFNEGDSGYNGHTITYKAYEDETPLLSGGVKVVDWEQVSGDIYRAPLNSNSKLRTLFVNGKRMRMAGTEEPIQGLGSWGEYEVTGDEPWAFGTGTAIDGIKFSTKDVSLFRNPEDIELVQNKVFNEKILCARGVEQIADTLILKLQQPYGAIATNMAWAGTMYYDKMFVVRNAYELLDTPGEFYFDKSQKMLYYYSSGEDMAKADVIAPIADGLLTIEGGSNDSRVENLHFEGITFSHDHWQLMEVEGSHAFAGIQSTGLAYKYIPDGNWHPTHYNSCNVPRGTVEIKNAENITFERNRFEGISSAIAINMVNDVKNSNVNGNFFHDLLGNAVNIGHPQHYEIGDGPHFAPNVEGLCEGIFVTNNYVRNACLDFRQVEGLSAYFVADVHFDHNDVAQTPYGAIAMGWWWGNSEIPPSTVAKNNSMSFNKAGDTHLSLGDGGILYLLGEQPGTMVEGNYIFNGPRCIYPDDGSAGLTIRRNVVLNERGHFWLHIWRFACHDIVSDENYVRDNNIKNNGTDCPVSNVHSAVTLNDLPKEAEKIIAEAGIQEPYRDIIPTEESELIELYPCSFKDTDH